MGRPDCTPPADSALRGGPALLDCGRLNLLDRYILREWLKMFGLLMAATVGVLCMASLYDDFRDLIQLGVRAGDILLYYATLMPSYFSVVLPISMLLSLLFVLSKLHRNNELTAVRSAGLNIFATTRSLWLAAIVLCGVSLLLNARVVPWSVEASRSLLESFRMSAQRRTAPASSIGLVFNVTFDNQRQNRMWYINRYDRYTGIAYGVTVSQLDLRRREKSRIMAREGTYDAVHRGWTFQDGRELFFDPGSGDVLPPKSFVTKTVPRFTEDPTLMLLIDRNPKDLSFNELRRIVDFFAFEENPKLVTYEVRYYGLLADTLGPLIILAIAIPFALSGVRVSPAVGVSKSIGLFVVYYVLSNFASILGGSGILHPVWAAVMPSLAMVGLAAFLFGRMR